MSLSKYSLVGIDDQGSTIRHDVLASVVVFLVALPLCLGIAIASGVPPIAGIIGGVIGGLIVASLGGNAMQVSGPANGLIVVVALVSNDYGLEVLGAIVLLAGAMQVVAGGLKLGQWFRAVPPATVHGMMTGFAVIIFASQFHVMLDDLPRTGPLQNLFSIPEAIRDAFLSRDGSHHAAIVGVATLAVLLSWKPLAPRRLQSIPASIVAVLVGAAVAQMLNLQVNTVQLPRSLYDAMTPISVGAIARLGEWPVFEIALTVAFLASAESLLSATAVDQLRPGSRTNYDRELFAQGVGNIACGMVGALPITGVIIRSATNVAAGAQTRLSSILHGVWLLLSVVALSGVLTYIPIASLAAVLLVAVFKLISMKALRNLWAYDKREILIYALTAAAVVSTSVMTGVVLGIVLALAKLIYTFSHLVVKLEEDPKHEETVLHLEGAATFVRLPKLAAVLETVRPDTHLDVRFENLNYIDHACLDLLMNWEEQHKVRGGSLALDWDGLKAKFGRNGSNQAVPATENNPAVDFVPRH